MEELLEYISRYRPQFAREIRGATEEEIAQLERLVGEPLPDQYRSFLEIMGIDPGPFSFSNDDAMTIADITYYYRERDRGETKAPSDCVVIAWGGTEYEEQQLSLEQGSPTTSRVLVSSDEQILELYAASFEKLLFRRAFIQYPLLLSSSRGIYIGHTHEHQVEIAGGVARAHAFREHWFSDQVAFCGEREDGALILCDQLEGRPLTVTIAASKRSTITECARPFEKELRVTFSHW
jgi:SMI1/KNR4 family protein SUKH-1